VKEARWKGAQPIGVPYQVVALKDGNEEAIPWGGAVIQAVRVNEAASVDKGRAGNTRGRGQRKG
jgi:hypothetical protein